VEGCEVDEELDRRLRALPDRVPRFPQGRAQDAVPGAALNVQQGLTFFWGEGGDVDQPDDVVGLGSGIGDYRAAVGVADGQYRAGVCSIALAT